MSSNVDLRQLAIDRGDEDQPALRARRQILTRYVLPLTLVVGFLSLVVWASWDRLFPPTPVTVVPVVSATSELSAAGTTLFEAAGWSEPRPTPVRVAALAPGVVENLLVVEDQAVEAGEPIAELIRDDAELAYAGAQADLALREAELEEARSILKAAQTRLDQPVHLEAALGEAQAALAKIQTELKNLPFAIRRAEAELLAKQKEHEAKASAAGVVSGVNIAIAKSKLEAAQATLEELRNRESSLQNEQSALTGRRDALQKQLELLADEIREMEAAQAKVKAARARVEQSRVAVAEAKLRLDRMTVRAPVDGRVYQLIADPGTRIGSGMTQMLGHDGSTVVTLYRPKMLQVRVDVRFEDIPKVSLSQPVRIENAAISTPIDGKVLFLSSEADIQKNTLEVKVEIADPPPVLKPDMLVEVTFLSPGTDKEEAGTTAATTIYVPQQLISEGESGSFIWIADQSAKIARKQRIEVGRPRAGGLVEVISGLTVASRLITSDTEELADGQRIVISGEDSSLGE